MNKLSFSACFLVALGGSLVAMAGGGCSSSSSSSGGDAGSEVGPDSGSGADTGSDGATDSGSKPDTGSGADTGSSGDTGSPADGGSDGAECNIPPQTVTSDGGANPACDMCVTDKCDTSWCACAADPIIDDAGIPGCLSYILCVQSCRVTTDAGFTGCISSCSASYQSSEVTSGNTLLTCAAQYCATPCTQ